MPIKGLIFDLDGTLANTLPVCIKAYQETVEHFCNRIPDEQEIIAGFGPDDEGMLQRLIPGQLNQTLPYYLNAYEQLHHQLCPDLFVGIPKLLTTLKSKHIQTAIVSGKGRFSAKISLEILKLNRWIDLVETGFAHGPDKPRSLRVVLKRWNLLPDQAAYVGDAPYDMQAAREVGLLALGAAWADSSALTPNQKEVDYPIFYQIDSFLDWIQSSGRLSIE